MNNLNYIFTNSDVQTFLCTLAILPSIEIDDVSENQQEINNACCFSAVEKLSMHDTDFHPNEIRVMALSLIIADYIIKGEYVVPDNIKSELTTYMFSINKLLPIFSAVFD